MWPYAGGSPWGESVHLTVNALDNDDDVFPADTDYNAFGNKSWGLLNPAMGTGSNDAWDWLQGETTLNVHKPGDFEDHTVPFTIYANGKDKVDMHYQVLGTVKVSHPTPKGGGVITEFPPGPLGLGYTPEFGLAGDDEDLAAVPTKDGVYSFTLINADTDKAIKTLSNGTVVDFSVIGTNDLSVRANTNPDTVGSVRFGYDRKPNYKTENNYPYAIAGDSNGDYAAWTPTVGSHSLTATAYSGSNASGTKIGSPLTIQFSAQA